MPLEWRHMQKLRHVSSSRMSTIFRGIWAVMRQIFYEFLHSNLNFRSWMTGIYQNLIRTVGILSYAFLILKLINLNRRKTNRCWTTPFVQGIASATCKSLALAYFSTCRIMHVTSLTQKLVWLPACLSGVTYDVTILVLSYSPDKLKSLN